ncbi:MAG: sulfotransferase domain-containing protein [Cyanobacteria bacterium J06581_3]
MTKLSRKPILVTGTQRSGSTWVGNILALDKSCGYIHEPFNIEGCRRGICRANFHYWFTYISKENSAQFEDAITDTLNWNYSLSPEIKEIRNPVDGARLIRDALYFSRMKRQEARPIVKDPIAFFSSEWLASKQDMNVVVIIRHPAAFVSSLKAAKWDFPFEHFVNQEKLMDDILYPFRDEIHRAAQCPLDLVAQGSLLWKLFHHHVITLQEKRTDWLFVKHEDLCRTPIDSFQALFNRLNLDFSDEVMAKLSGYTKREEGVRTFRLFNYSKDIRRNSKKTIKSWKKRLSQRESERIRNSVEDVSKHFYSDSTW